MSFSAMIISRRAFLTRLIIIILNGIRHITPHFFRACSRRRKLWLSLPLYTEEGENPFPYARHHKMAVSHFFHRCTMNRIFLLLPEQGRELFERYGVWTWILPFENKDVTSWSSSVNVKIKIRCKTKKDFLQYF